MRIIYLVGALSRIYERAASYPMGTRCYFPGGKAAGAWSWPLTSI